MGQSERPYKIGFLGTMALAGAVLIFMYASTFPSEHINVIFGAVLMTVIGIAFAFIMVGLKIQPFQFKDFVESVVWTAVSVVTIWIINVTVPFKLEVAPLSTKLFSILMGVAEESFFRVWLCTFIFRMTKMTWLAIGMSSGIWALYHFNRYGGAGIGTFLVIFIAGCILGWVMLTSKMGDGVIFGHGIVNFLV
jgi:hypothetical protein